MKSFYKIALVIFFTTPFFNCSPYLINTGTSIIKAKVFEKKSKPVYRPNGVSDNAATKAWLKNYYTKTIVKLNTPSGPIEFKVYQSKYCIHPIFSTDSVQITFNVLINNKSQRHKININQIYFWKLVDNNNREWHNVTLRLSPYDEIAKPKYCHADQTATVKLTYGNIWYESLDELPDKLVLTADSWYEPGGYGYKMIREFVFERINEDGW